jgi:excisionase family DNA binding protein
LKPNVIKGFSSFLLFISGLCENIWCFSYLLEMINMLQDLNKHEFLTRKELASLFRVSYPTIHRWRQSGLISSYKFGKVVRFKYSEIVDLLSKAHLVNPKTEKNEA